MKKFILFYFILSQTLLIFGQNTFRNISIDVTNAQSLNLSEIAEAIFPIPLEDQDKIQNQNILLTNEYLFVSSIHSIIQYNLSGKFIRRIDCGGYVTDNVTNDAEKRLLYVPVRDTIKCYDYFGRLKKTYSLKSSSLHCLYNNGFLWVQSYNIQPDKSFVYIIQKINLTTGVITKLPFEKRKEPYQMENGSLVNISATCRLTLHDNEVIASFDFDNTLYRIQSNKVVPVSKEFESSVKIKQEKVVPLVSWSINPSAQRNDIWPMKANSFIGDYFFINYRRDNQFYFYLDNLKTGKKYNVSQLIDDVFHTDGNCDINSINQNGFFVFVKDQSDIKGDSIGNVLLKSGPVVFIGKIK